MEGDVFSALDIRPEVEAKERTYFDCIIAFR
jgi:hypothetical protein